MRHNKSFKSSQQPARGQVVLILFERREAETVKRTIDSESMFNQQQKSSTLRHPESSWSLLMEQKHRARRKTQFFALS